MTTMLLRMTTIMMTMLTMKMKTSHGRPEKYNNGKPKRYISDRIPMQCGYDASAVFFKIPFG